ncbi:hypothetical protein ACJ41O_001192 [Fusarium nematophilum]
MAPATPAVPKQHKAVVYDKPGTISTKIVSIDTPEPGPGELLINLQEGVCFNQKISGYYTPGTFQQYVLAPASYVTPIPEGLPSADAAPFLCAGVTVYSALLRSQAKPGNWVVISGAGGGLGHLACQIGSRALGMRIIGIDHGSKADIVKNSGAEHFVDVAKFPGDADITAHVKSLADGLGAHAVVVCTASNKAYGQSVDLLRFNGTVVCVGVPEGNLVPMAGANPFSLITQQKTIVGSSVGNQHEALEVLGFAARGIVKPHFETKKMEDLTQIFKDMHAGKLQGRIVLDLS